MHLHTLFWEGLRRHHQREATAQRRSRPLPQWPGRVRGPLIPVDPASLAGYCLLQGHLLPNPSELTPRGSWPQRPQRPSTLSEIDPQGSARLSLGFRSEAMQVFVNCFPVRSRGHGTMPCIVAILPSPSSPELTQCFGVLGRWFCSECELMPKPYLAKLAFKIILNAPGACVSYKIKDHVECR